jgi:hypothetical protein
MTGGATKLPGGGINMWGGAMKLTGRVVLPLVLLVAGCSAEASPQPHAASAPAGKVSAQPQAAPAGKASPCGSAVVTDALPTWARAGFSDDGSGTPHVFGRSGDILGVMFGAPLKAPPAPDRSNKILWVSRAPLIMGDDLKITAKLDGGDETVEREVLGGPGPSIIDLPKAGCWRLTLRWSGHTDTMDLTYSP